MPAFFIWALMWSGTVATAPDEWETCRYLGLSAGVPGGHLEYLPCNSEHLQIIPCRMCCYLRASPHLLALGKVVSWALCCLKMDHRAELVTYCLSLGGFCTWTCPVEEVWTKQEESALAVLVFRPVSSLYFLCFTLPLPQNSEMLLVLDDAFIWCLEISP